MISLSKEMLLEDIEIIRRRLWFSCMYIPRKLAIQHLGNTPLLAKVGISKHRNIPETKEVPNLGEQIVPPGGFERHERD